MPIFAATQKQRLQLPHWAREARLVVGMQKPPKGGFFFAEFFLLTKHLNDGEARFANG